MIRNNLNIWSDTHVFYNQFDNSSRKEFCIESKDEYIWKENSVKQSPNGDLIINNSFFKDLKTQNKIYLAHITYGLEDIIRTKSLFASGGCLVGSIYCTPLTVEGDSFRMHNLGAYIYEYEASILAKKDRQTTLPSILIFEVDSSSLLNPHFIGVDYLNLGEVHLSIYKELEYLLSNEERFSLHELIVKRVKNSMEFLTLSSSIYYEGKKTSPENYIDCYIETIPRLTILGYIYFEVISEYIMLFQDSKIAMKYKDLGELYNPSYKDLMYNLQPGLRENFKLSSFAPSLKSVAEYIVENKIISNFDYQNFAAYVKERLVSITMSKLLKNTKEIEWRNFVWDFENILETLSPLIGHLIHRELRNFGRYPSLYFYFDQTKALRIWNYWNHMDVIVPFNGVIPKGEVGINPAYPDLKYKVFLGETFKKNGVRFLKASKELDISIEPRLVELRYTNMRNKSNQINLKT